MAEQIFTDGDVQSIGGQLFECVSVSYTQENGERVNHVYGFRLKSELDAERELARKREELLATNDSPEAVAAAPAPGELSQPEAPKEETHYVK